MTPDPNGPSRQSALADIDVAMLAMAISSSDGGFYDPADGSVHLASMGEVIDEDGEPVDLDEVDWIQIDSLDSRTGYLDMEQFTDVVTDPVIADRLERALNGKGAFRRFRDSVFEVELGRTWSRYSNALENIRALEWLVENAVVDKAESSTAIKEQTGEAEKALKDAAAWRQGDAG